MRRIVAVSECNDGVCGLVRGFEVVLVGSGMVEEKWLEFRRFVDVERACVWG